MAGILNDYDFHDKTGLEVEAELNISLTTLRSSMRKWEAGFDGSACHHEDKIYLLRDGGDPAVEPSTTAPGSVNWLHYIGAGFLSVDIATGSPEAQVLTNGFNYKVDTTSPNTSGAAGTVLDGIDYVNLVPDISSMEIGDSFQITQLHDAPVALSGVVIDGYNGTPLVNLQNYGAKTTVTYTLKALPIGLETSGVPIGSVMTSTADPVVNNSTMTIG